MTLRTYLLIGIGVSAAVRLAFRLIRKPGEEPYPGISDLLMWIALWPVILVLGTVIAVLRLRSPR